MGSELRTRNSQLSVQRLPGIVSPMIVRTEDARLNVDTSGSGAPTLVLVHGLGGSSASWDAVREPLAREFRVWTPELRGCGSSERGTADYSLSLLAADLREVVRTAAQQGSVVLVGHSLGGVIVQALLTTCPDDVCAAVLVSTSSHLSQAATDNWVRLASTVERKGLSNKPEAQARGFSEAYAAAHPEMLAQQAKLAELIVPAVYAEQARAASSYDFDKALGDVTIPALILQGLGDRMTPVGGSVLLNRALRNSRLELIEEVGHNVQIEAAAEFVQLVLHFVRTSCT